LATHNGRGDDTCAAALVAAEQLRSTALDAAPRRTAVVCWIWMVRGEGNGTTERYGVRGPVGVGVLVVLEEHWLWADVQVEGGVERDARCGKRNGALGGSGIAAREEST
jgi:hypothetical protein